MNESYLSWKGWDRAEFGRCGREDALYYAKELRTIGIFSVDGLRIGELGYGNGAFAGWVRSAGGRWFGKEASQELLRRGEGAGFAVFGLDIAFSTICGSSSLDLIVAFDVIEHMNLEAIRSFLTDAKAALRAGGQLLVRCPSGDSPFSGAMYRGDLTHRTLLGSSAIRALAKETGLEIRQIRSPSLPVWGLGPIRAARRMAVLTAHYFAFALVGRVLMGAADAVISPNKIVVLQKNCLPT